MSFTFKRIAIIGKYMNPTALLSMRSELVGLVEHLQAKELKVYVEANTVQHAQLVGFEMIELHDIGQRADLAIVLGGDGTMLSVARSLIMDDVPLVGINRGRFGFLTDLRSEDMLAALDRILAGEYIRDTRMLLCGQVIRNGEIIYSGHALNDVVIKSGLRLIELEVRIDRQFVHKQRSDGLILTTPTGTTAYSLSAGGPILHPNLEAITLVPVCPHTLSNRPITVSSNSEIEISLLHTEDAQASFDGQYQIALEAGDTIYVRRANHSISLLHPSDYCYFDMLRNKLNWG